MASHLNSPTSPGYFLKPSFFEEFKKAEEGWLCSLELGHPLSPALELQNSRFSKSSGLGLIYHQLPGFASLQTCRSRAFPTSISMCANPTINLPLLSVSYVYILFLWRATINVFSFLSKAKHKKEGHITKDNI